MESFQTEALICRRHRKEILDPNVRYYAGAVVDIINLMNMISLITLLSWLANILKIKVKKK